jgi:hypothetical protein
MGPAASQALQQLEDATDQDTPLQSQGTAAELAEVQKLTGASYQMLKGFIAEHRTRRSSTTGW